jgi:hypothetical protein
MRFHVIRPELVDRAGYRKVFFVQIFSRENFVGQAILNEERAAFNLKRSCRGSCHHLPPGRTIATPPRANLRPQLGYADVPKSQLANQPNHV